MPFLDNFLNEVKDDIFGLAKEKLGGRVTEAKDDTQAFLERTQDDFDRWMNLLKSSELRQEEFVWLARGKKDLLELHTLKQAGLSLVEAEIFKDELLNVIVRGALNMLKLGS